jgi:hypothetical protein
LLLERFPIGSIRKAALLFLACRNFATRTGSGSLEIALHGNDATDRAESLPAFRPSPDVKPQ